MFQSTRPMRGATGPHTIFPTGLLVSIHAPHAGRDVAWTHINFDSAFQSTRPMRGAT